jgi:RES domain-containing protein
LILWRIATETRAYGADDLSGAGAAKSPGRWNDTGQRVLYAAPTIAIAVLETAAHIDDAGLPLNRYLVELTVPDAVWNVRETLRVVDLDVTWAAIPAGRETVRRGSDWYARRSSAMLEVPSVIVPEESAVVINMEHPDAAAISARIHRLFEYNRLFRGA